MALRQTSLTSAISNAQLYNLALADCTGFADKQLVKIDNEYMYEVGPPTAPTGPGAITVRMRGSEGTPAVAHDVLAVVSTSASPADFPSLAPGTTTVIPAEGDDVQTIGQDQTVTPPQRNTTYLIQKATAAAITLNNGTPAQVGQKMTFISGTAQAHVITYPAGFLGGANTKATFPALVGAAFLVQVGAGGILTTVGSGNDAADITFSA